MRSGLAALFALVVLAPGWTQDAASRKPGVFALRNATLALDPATTLTGTLVLRGGLIEAAGAEAPIPADAEIIDATGLHVYPGFIDALSSAGLGDTKRSADERKKSEATPADFVADSLGGMETANRKGIRPEFRAAEVVAFGEEDLKKHHKGGFTAVHVAASEEYLGGSTALVTLGGGTRREIVVVARPGLVGSFRSYGDGYPSTPMGVMAHLRQVFQDARRLRELTTAYEKEPQGRVRPPSDRGLEALWPAFDREIPLFLEANTELEIARALQLASEFKFDLVITGGREAGAMADRLKETGTRVVLSLKFPREPKRPKKASTEPLKEGEYEELPKAKKQYDDEKREWERRVRSAVALHEKGVPFAFSTAGLDEPATALKQIFQLVSRGLPREAALKALTESPASIVRASAMYGRLAPGRAGNVTVLTAPLGSPEARARFVFADGRKFDLEPGGKGEAAPEINLTGAWTFTIEKSDAGPLTIKAVLKQTGSELTGVLKSAAFEGGTVMFGRVTGRTLSLVALIKLDGDDTQLTVTGSKKDDVFEGKLVGPFGDEVKWTGKKDP